MSVAFCISYGIENIADLPEGCDAIFVFSQGEYDSYGVSFVAFDESSIEYSSSHFFANFDPVGITPLGYLKLRSSRVMIPVETTRAVRLKLPDE